MRIWPEKFLFEIKDILKDEYDAFYNALIEAEAAPLKAFDKELQEDLTVFEGLASASA